MAVFGRGQPFKPKYGAPRVTLLAPSSLGDIVYRGISGLWRRLIGSVDSNRRFLSQRGDGTVSAAPSWERVADSDLLLSDITTNDVSTSRHGFVPKAPNDATKYLNGVGAYAVPSGSGGLVLLASLTAASSASLDFATRNAAGQSGAIIQSDFSVYEIVLDSIVPVTNSTGLLMRMSTDGGATYDATAGHYSWQGFAMAFNATGANGSTSDTSINVATTAMNSAAKISQSVTLRLYNPLSTALYKLVTGLGNITDTSRSTASLGVMIAGKYLVDSSAVNAFRFLSSSGGLTSGTIRVYGVYQ